MILCGTITDIGFILIVIIINYIIHVGFIGNVSFIIFNWGAYYQVILCGFVAVIDF